MVKERTAKGRSEDRRIAGVRVRVWSMEREKGEEGEREGRAGSLVALVCGTLVYYHCGWRESSAVSLAADVLIVLLCSLAILGMLFRQMSISVPVDPLEWQISQDTANSIFACLANTIGAAESVLRVAATGHDKRLFFKVIAILYLLASLGRLASGATVAYAGLCIFCLYLLVESSQLFRHWTTRFIRTRDSLGGAQD
ncbi:putative reticulon-like protein B22/B23 [Dioscorea sansibarensis]